MKRTFKVEKMPLEELINLLIELYENGADFVDLSSDNTDPGQDKLIVKTRDEYINPEYLKKFNDKIQNDDTYRKMDEDEYQKKYGDDAPEDDDDDDEPLPYRPRSTGTTTTSTPLTENNLDDLA